jgi:hypothetical protein
MRGIPWRDSVPSKTVGKTPAGESGDSYSAVGAHLSKYGG